jgi:hypothetical protein
MPNEDMEVFRKSTLIPEDRKIKLGENLSNRPGRLQHPVVTLPLKTKGQTNFAHDEDIMDSIRDRWDLKKRKRDDQRSQAEPLPGIPIYCVSDDPFKNIFLYRGVYRKSGSLCKRVGEEKMATRWFNTEAHKNGSLKILNEPQQIECNKECHLWDTDCGWRGVVSLQLQDRPRFPSATRYRTTGFYQLMSMIGTMRAILEVTEGVLMGIPLVLRKYEMDVKQSGTDKDRRIPVVSYDFDGTTSDLRRHAIEELRSRAMLREAAAGIIKWEKPEDGVSFHPQSLGDNALSDADEGNLEDLDDLIEGEASNAQAATPPSGPSKEELIAEIKKVSSKLDYTPARLKLLVGRHNSDLTLVLEDLNKQAGTKAKEDEPLPEALEPDDVQPSSNRASSEPDFMDGNDWGPGEEGGAEDDPQPEQSAPEEEAAEDDNEFNSEGWMPGL